MVENFLTTTDSSDLQVDGRFQKHDDFQNHQLHLPKQLIDDCSTAVVAVARGRDDGTTIARNTDGGAALVEIIIVGSMLITISMML